MVDELDFREQGEALGNACAVVRSNGASAGLAAPVPTCPGWTVADLVAHLGMIHRYVTCRLTGEPGFEEVVAIAEAHAAADMLEWFDEGMVALLNAIVTTRDADSLRRQVHETTIHGVDAMAARLGRAPRAEELWVPPRLAADGVDEVLGWVLPRPRYALTSPRPRRVVVASTDTDRYWLLEIGPGGTTTTRLGGPADADAVAYGTARELYLAVWNRVTPGATEALATEDGWWDAWRQRVQVTWG